MLVSALGSPLEALSSVPLMTGLVIAVFQSLARFGASFNQCATSGHNGVEPIELEVLKGTMVCKKQVGAFSDPHSNSFVQVDDGRVRMGGGGSEQR